jgi:PAS domain S-box-containing protein
MEREIDQLFELRQIVDAAPDGIFSVDADHSIRFVNPKIAEMFGYHAEELIHRNIEILIPEPFREQHRKHEVDYLTTPRTQSMAALTNLLGRRRDGSLIPIELSLSPVHTSHGLVVAGIVRDVTEQRELKKTLQQAVTVRNDLLAMVAHDLRNPLNALLLLVEGVLRSPLPTPDPARRLIESMKRVIERMNALVGDLVESASLEAGHLLLARREHEPQDLVDEVLRQFRPIAGQKEVTLRAELQANLPSLRYDHHRLLRVLSNLIDNAIKFTPTGGLIIVRAEQRAGAIYFAVTDTGAGIPEEQLSHLFDRYWQAKASSDAGAGLGLYIAKGIIEAHGGSIGVESRVGTGATFFFTIPATEMATHCTEAASYPDIQRQVLN